MSSKFVYLEKFATAPSPSRDYYGIKVVDDQVILNQWKISHGPHSLPLVRVIKFSDFKEDKGLKHEILHVFGSKLYDYIETVTSNGARSLLTLPKSLIEKLVQYLNIKDIIQLLCVSQLSNEIFSTNFVWEILFKRAKRSSVLTEMEKELGVNHGFKKLVKDHHIRNAVKRHFKSKDDKSARSEKTTERSEKIGRSASVDIPKITSQVDNLVSRKQSMDGEPRKAQKTLKTSIKYSSVAKNKKFDLPKKNTSTEKPSSSLFLGTENFMEKHAAGESYPIKKTKSKTKPEQRLSKFKFINENNESTELLLQKKYLKSALVKTELSNIGMDDLLPKPNAIVKSNALGELKSKPSDKSVSHKKAKSTKNTSHGNAGDKTVDSDESGMSFLMKRYLAASDEVARKFSECERLARSTKSTQADIKPRRKSAKKGQKHVPSVETALVRSTGSATNIFSKLKKN